MNDGFFHRQPLRQRMLAGDHDIDVVAAAQAMVGHRQQAVRIGREVDPNDVGLLVDDMVDEARVLVCEAVVVLLPDVRSQQVIQRGDGSAPRQLTRHLQPFGVLTEHRIDDADEGFVAVEQAVTPSQQIAFEPALALVLAQHRVKHLPVGREVLVARHRLRIPLTGGDFEHRAEQIGQCLVGPEQAEVALVPVQQGQVPQEVAEHHRVLRLQRARHGHRYRMCAEVGHLQFAQQQPTVGVRIGAHATLALRCQRGQFRQEPAARVEQFVGAVAPHPGLEQREVLGEVLVHQQRHLVRAKGVLDLQAVDFLRPGPALG